MTGESSRAVARALIRELVHSGRHASPEDIARIRDLMATAPFDPARIPIPARFRDRGIFGEPTGTLEPSLRYHLLKRTLVEKQWAEGTSESAFLGDLRRSILTAKSRLLLYQRRGGLLAACVSATEEVVPAQRLGQDFLPQLIVIYSADRDIIVSGYQFSTLDEVSIPREARWLT